MTQKNPMQEHRNGRSQGGEFGSDLKRGTADVVGAAKETASTIANEAKEQMSTRVAAKKDKAAEGLSSVAEALRSSTGDIGDQVPFVGEYANKAAEGVEQLSNYIQTRTIGELIDDVEGFARREPALFLGGAFAIGLIAGRFLKSSPRAIASDVEGYGGSSYGTGYEGGSSYGSTDPGYGASQASYGESYTASRYGGGTTQTYGTPSYGSDNAYVGEAAGTEASPYDTPTNPGIGTPSTSGTNGTTGTTGSTYDPLGTTKPGMGGDRGTGG
jgi:hypothetical protein